MSDKMKVKVTKLNNPYVWYRGLVGDVFEVEQEAKGDKYFCPTENGSFYISDCELVAEPKELIRDKIIVLPVKISNGLFIRDAHDKPIAPLEDGYIQGTFIKADHICSLLNQPQRATISEDKVKELKQRWILESKSYMPNADWQWIVDNLITPNHKYEEAWIAESKPAPIPIKSLRELAEDVEACKEIAHSLGLCFEGVVIEGDLIKIKTGDVVKGHLCISSDGDMSFHDEYTECRRILNCFQIVKLLLSKGYDVTK